MSFQYKFSQRSALLGILLCIFSTTIGFASETVKLTSIERYQQALKVDPNNPALHYILGLAQLNNGQAREAITSFRSAYPSNTDSIELNYNLGLAFSQIGDADSALIYLEQAEALGALSMANSFSLVNAYYNVALIYLDQESLSEASNIFGRVLSLDPARVEIYRLLGDIAARNGHPEEAITHFTNYLELYPDDQASREYLYALLFNRALKFMENEQDEAAQTSFVKAQAIAPDSPLIHYYLGSLAYKSGDISSTINHLAPVYQFVPDELKASTRSMLYNSARKSLDSKHLNQAVTGISPLILTSEAKVKDLMLSGFIYLERQEFKIAREMFNRVLEIDPTHPQATINLSIAEDKVVEELFQEGLIAYQQDHFREALDLFNKVLEIQPNEHRSTSFRKKCNAKIESDAKNIFTKAQQALDRDDYLKAVMLVNEGLTLAPNDTRGLRLRRSALKALEADIQQRLETGFELLDRFDYSAAEAQFTMVIEIDPENLKAQKGLSQSKRDRRTKALAEITKGNLALDEGNLEIAGRHFTLAEKLVSTLPQTIEARARLNAIISSLVAQELQWGRQSLSAGDLNQAEAHFQKALLLNNSTEIRRELESIKLAQNNQAEGLLKAARTAVKQKDYKTARSIYNRILTINPQHPAAAELKTLNTEIKTDLALILKSAGEMSKQKRYSESLSFYRQALDLDPTNIEAQQGLQEGRNQIKSLMTVHLQEGRSAFEKGDLKKASAAYNKVLQLDPFQAEAKSAFTRITSLEQTGIRPGDENKLYLQGIELYTQGKYLEAIRSWEQVLQLDLDHNKARMNIEKAKRKLQSIQEFKSG